MAAQSPRKKAKRLSPRKKNDKKTQSNDSSEHKRPQCPDIISGQKCECWIRLKKYCEHFKMETSDTKKAMDFEEVVAKYTNTLRRTSSKQLDYDMTELWQHYILYHAHDHSHAYSQCVLHDLCPFVKGTKNHNEYNYYRKRSWNLSQTMHVYFYHTQEYLQARGSAARKHRYIRERSAFRSRVRVPLHNNGNAVKYVQAASPININQSATLLQNKNTFLAQASTAELEPMVHLELGPGFSHHSAQSNDDNHPPNIDITLVECHHKDDDDSDLNQLTELQTNDYYAIEYQQTTQNLSLRYLEFGTPFVAKAEDATHKNPKDEILNNCYAPITKGSWNELLKTCVKYSKKQNTRVIGLQLKEVVGLKLYTDFDGLQHEYRKSYRENQADRMNRQRQFYHWNSLLLSACAKSTDVIVDTLYHGVSEPFSTPSYSGTYYGPISTTLSYDIAKQFAGVKGRIFELYPTFARRGLKVGWLSNFPDEGEVLYMNTSFQIVNVYDNGVSLQDVINYKNPLLKENDILFEKSILKALHVLNTESNVISFSDMQDLPSEQDFKFHRLDEHEQISILYLLYLQYSKDWDKFWKKQKIYKRIAFAKYRDQFIVLAKNVVAVKMERIPMLVQHFFYESHKKYKFPFKSGDIENGLHHVREQFIANQPLRFETITRLFPNTQQLLINGNNFDWSLERLIKFMQKYNLEDVIKLQDIEIRFVPQYPHYNAKYDADEEEAAKRLRQYKAHKNITKLKKLGWIFSSPCHLRRVGFEPLHELPFLMVFMSYDKEIMYRTYSRQILNKSLINTGSRRTEVSYSYTMDGQTRGKSLSVNIPGAMIKRTSSNNTLSANSYKKLPFVDNASLSPGVMTPLNETTPLHDIDEGKSYVGIVGITKQKSAGSSYKYMPQYSLSGMRESEEKSLSLQQTYYSTTGTFSGYEGQNPLVLNYNPQNCILCNDVLDKLEYKEKLIEMMKWRVDYPKLKKPVDATQKKFIKYTQKVEVLVIDPMPFELATVFLEIPSNKKPVISFSNIYKLFPNVTDIFLRHTQLNMRIIYKIIKFVEQNDQTHIERIFFSKNTTIGTLVIPELQRKLKKIHFSFYRKEQMIFKNYN